MKDVNMGLNFIKLFKLIIVLFLFSFPLATHSSQEWLADEMLEQLTEIKQELKSLKAEVKSLKSDLQTGGKYPAAKKIPEISVDDTLFLGSKDATVAIIEYSDYQCPYCRRHNLNTVPEIKKQFIDTGKAKYITRAFPLSFHTKARGASIAGLCIAEQDPSIYWSAHDKLLTVGNNKLEESHYIAMAEELGLSTSGYKKCLDNPAVGLRVDNQMSTGKGLGVSGTPATFIGTIEGGKLVNVRTIVGAQSFSVFKAAIESNL